MDSSDNDRLADHIAGAVERRLASSDPRLKQLVAEEVQAVLASPAARSSLRLQARDGEPAERVVVTANGKNRGGVVAALAQCIDEFKGDIRDISQTIVGDYFTMIIVVDIGAAHREGSRFSSLRERLTRLGEELGIHVVAMHDDILSTMHSV